MTPAEVDQTCRELAVVRDRIEGLYKLRLELILALVDAGLPERTVAKHAGLTGSRINQIKAETRDGKQPTGRHGSGPKA